MCKVSFFVQYISSHVLNISEFLLGLRTRENTDDIFITLDENIILVFTSKKLIFSMNVTYKGVLSDEPAELNLKALSFQNLLCGV